ncbi:venom dipeptidyl peptidase 4 [Copidosoma floridanum]|uniref:venom dipeptidyl peptidase 4 n=1 Tax=Copidosoma floridanum TaxID=29053 RepID=UPI0006C96028|nr:venom dipeptidyl peptidase 4 [Copidosoma floridanum]
MTYPKLIGLLCFQLIILTTARSTTTEAPSQDGSGERKAFSLDDIASNAYTSLSFNGTWISETEIFYRIDELLLVFDVKAQSSKVIANSSIFDDEENMKYYVSPDGNFVLLRNSTKKVYRHSGLNKFSIYNVKSEELKPLEDGQLISVAVWAPRGSELIYVLKNDIYHYQAKLGETRRLTFDGKSQTLYNGIPDWVYEEEVYSTDRALWLSPNGDYLAFGTFNDSYVPEAVVMRYGTPGDLQDQYPSEERFRYPKAGASNPHVTLNVINLKDKQSSMISLKAPVHIVGAEAILYAVTWFDEKTVVATWTNRVQNHSQIVSYPVTAKEPQLLLEQKVTGGWLLFPANAPLHHRGYVLILRDQPVENKTLGSFGHLTRYTLSDNGTLKDELDLSPGETWVHSLVGVSEAKAVVYYTACPPGEPSQKHLYEVNLEPEDLRPEPKCVSCKLKTPEGNDCKYVSSVKFSRDFSRYVMTCAGPDPAIIKIYDSRGTELYTWSDNHALRHMLAKRVLPQQMDLTFPLNGFDVRVRLQLPQDFDPSKKYPLYVNVYAGPGSQAIIDNFSVGYDKFATTAKNIIEAKIDGRGTNSRGTAMLYSVYRNLGSAEMEDQIDATKLLQEQFSWIDRNRTAIGGWSYGGYSAATILTKDRGNVFKCGHSGAPVTNWMYYDSIYTERYMGLPTTSDNLNNYEESSVMRRAKNFKGKKFLLIHGTGDDNVHFQNSMALTKALAENDVAFEQFIYPDEAHQFVHLAQHLYRVTDNFISDCFGIEVPEKKK